MKFQLVILSALLVSAFALPVPDEEVSPVVQAVPQVQEKSVEVQKVNEKVADVVKPVEARAAELPAAAAPALANEEKKDLKPVELPLNAPDSEISQSLLAEKKEEKKDKQTRADDKVEETKALPVAAATAPVAGLAEEPKQAEETLVAAEEKTNIEGKSTIIAEAAPAEQKKDELSAAEETPVVKTDSALAATADIAPAATELKKEETPARQERVGEAVNEVDANVVPAASVVAEVAPAVKSLLAEEAAPAATPVAATPALTTDAALEQPAEPEKQLPEAPKELLKSAASEPIAQEVEPAALAPAGDIPLQASEESAAKALKVEEPAPAAPVAAVAAPEAKKIEEPAAAAPAPAELPQQQQKELTPEVKESEPKTLEEKKPVAEAEKLSESKKSKDSNSSSDSSESESKESSESKEEKSD
ncbi:enolase-phosphatase E1 [Bactrocera tryoni]|uniref:enolase-phosphatase E1 n=1 Tax=Bactrocera tryoni TaxID=59916 RepID=UPI001A98B2DC|nr:enolase-phosphatase E1 [Bactrocera tryoni]XP_039958654.1 enolase-phosphatase E1 [Bactrocera tryoni]